MLCYRGQSVSFQRTTSSPTTGNPADTVTLPEAVVIVDGQDTDIAVTVENVESEVGAYRFTFIVPDDARFGTVVEVRIKGQIGSTTGLAVLWSATVALGATGPTMVDHDFGGIDALA